MYKCCITLEIQVLFVKLYLFKNELITCLSDRLNILDSSVFLVIVMYRLKWNSFSSSKRCKSVYTTLYLSLVRVLPINIHKKKKKIN